MSRTASLLLAAALTLAAAPAAQAAVPRIPGLSADRWRRASAPPCSCPPIPRSPGPSTIPPGPAPTSMIDPGASGAAVDNVEVESTCGRPADHTALINDPASLGLIEWGPTRAPGDHAPVCGAAG